MFNKRARAFCRTDIRANSWIFHFFQKKFACLVILKNIP